MSLALIGIPVDLLKAVLADMNVVNHTLFFCINPHLSTDQTCVPMPVQNPWSWGLWVMHGYGYFELDSAVKRDLNSRNPRANI